MGLLKTVIERPKIKWLLSIGAGFIILTSVYFIFFIRDKYESNRYWYEFGWTNGACQTDMDCSGPPADAYIEISITPPCYKGKCQYPKTVRGWIDFCDQRKGKGLTFSEVTDQCYSGAARAATKYVYSKTDGTYKPDWSKAFEICEKYYSVDKAMDDQNQCKYAACNTLPTYENNIKISSGNNECENSIKWQSGETN